MNNLADLYFFNLQDRTIFAGLKNIKNPATGAAYKMGVGRNVAVVTGNIGGNLLNFPSGGQILQVAVNCSPAYSGQSFFYFRINRFCRRVRGRSLQIVQDYFSLASNPFHNERSELRGLPPKAGNYFSNYSYLDFIPIKRLVNAEVVENPPWPLT